MGNPIQLKLEEETQQSYICFAGKTVLCNAVIKSNESNNFVIIKLLRKKCSNNISIFLLLKRSASVASFLISCLYPNDSSVAYFWYCQNMSNKIATAPMF